MPKKRDTRSKSPKRHKSKSRDVFSGRKRISSTSPPSKFKSVGKKRYFRFKSDNSDSEDSNSKIIIKSQENIGLVPNYEISGNLDEYSHYYRVIKP
ncbi:hypothetical protein HZS_5628 [Henneguya salminicola]|nr:hypothetical protein HZS_5628 [Henneguya salminicola]